MSQQRSPNVRQMSDDQLRQLAGGQAGGEFRGGDALLSGLADIVTFGRGDELQGIFGGAEAVQRSRARQAELQAMHPGWYLGGQLAGGVIGGGGIGAAGRLGLRGLGAAERAANITNRIGPIGRTAAAVGAGALGGGVYGYNSGTDGNRLESAASQILPGAIGGGVGNVLGEALGAGVRIAGRSMGPEAAAAGMIGNAQRRFGQVGDDFQRALADAPEGATVMDVIPGGPQLAAGASARPSAELPRIDAALRERNERMAQETIDDLWTSLSGGGRRSAGVTVRQLRQQRTTQAAPFYERAFARAIDPRRAENLLGETIRRNPRLFRAAEADAQELMLSEHGTVFNKDDPRFYHYLQQGADQVFERLRSAQGGLSGNERRVFGNALRAYRVGLNRLLGPDFRRAQALWSNPTRQAAAVRRGYEAVTTNANDLDLEELADEMRVMTPGELEHMRLGALARLADMIENSQSTTGRSNPVRAVLRSEGQRRVLQRLFGGQAQLDNVIRRIEQRQQLYDNAIASGIGVNSHTANRLAARESQVAQTNPFRGGGLWERVENAVLGGAADQWDEAVSNQLLRELATPASEALRAVNTAGGVRQWARGRGLLAAAQRQAMEHADFRRRAMANALTGNLFWGIGGAEASGSFGQ